jgi:hypothetical protein
MTRRLITSAILALALTCSLAAADKPDFTGSWKINAAKSDFGPMPPPDKWDMVVEHKDPALKVKTTMANQMGERTNEAAYTTDGKETTVGEGGGQTQATVTWDGESIVFKTLRKANMQGEQIEIKGVEKWTLSGDGKTLTVDMTLTAPMGEFQMKRVMDKQ